MFKITHQILKQQIFVLLASFLVANILVFFSEDVSQNFVKFLKPYLVSAGLKKGWVIYDDKNGVPINDYGVQDGVYIGKQRYPILIAQRAFDYHEAYVHGDTTAKRLLLNCADWLVENAVHQDSAAFLEATFPWKLYNLTPPWRSSMAHGQALKALIYAHQATNDQKYLDFGEQLLNAFFVDVQDGGITHKSETDGWWFDEYAHPEALESRVLNGMMFSMMGVRAFYEQTHNPKAKYLFGQGVIALKNNLHRYDKNGYSSYDLLGQPSGWHYHQVHIDLLAQIHEMTGEPIFKQYSDRWADYLKKPFLWRAVLNPSKMGWAILLLNFWVAFLLGEGIYWGFYRRSGRR